MAGELTATRFELAIKGHSLGVFSDLETIASEVDVVEHTSGTETAPSRLPGRQLPPVVRLRRGLTRNIEMAAWHELVVLGDVAAARKSCSLTMFDAAGEPIARYHLTNAWPRKVEITELEAGGAAILLETVTLTCDFLQRVSV